MCSVYDGMLLFQGPYGPLLESWSLSPLLCRNAKPLVG